MPQLGETVAEGKVTKWFKSAGDAVKPGDNLFEIETDKTSMEVPATFGGTLSEVHFQVGEVAKVGAVVAVIGGAEVFALFLDRADRIELTEVLAEIPGDTFMPDPRSEGSWREIACEDHLPEGNREGFRFTTLVRD